MKNVKSYSDFIVESIEIVEPLNESIFDKIKGPLTQIANLFKDVTKLNKQVDAAETKAAKTNDNVKSKSVKIGGTFVVKLVDPRDSTKKSLLSLTKLADLPDGSGLYQISGSDNEQFLASLGVEDVAKLNVQGVLAIVNPEGFVTTKPLTMFVFKNVSKDGKPIVTQAVIAAFLDLIEVSKEAVK
jgi:hypothetical protein